jgi:hypothetical protein
LNLALFLGKLLTLGKKIEMLLAVIGILDRFARARFNG